tara:strand:- start:374 stop:589 length:216 start_codon:yes stop_codon:yes gene_type:complete
VSQLCIVFVAAMLCAGSALIAQVSPVREESFEDKDFLEEVMENPGEYSFILITFLVLGYVLWRVQRLGQDD